MNTSQPPNPISYRLEKINQLWQCFRSDPEAKVCRWLISPDEKQMLEVFLETTYREDNPSDDFFLPFYTGFTDTAAYSGGLVEELAQAFTSDRGSLETEGMQISWQPQRSMEEDEHGVHYFLENVYRFAEEIPTEELFVAVLMPAFTGRHYAKWFTEVLRAGLPGNLRILVTDIKGEEKLAELGKNYPKLMKSSSLDLDMPDAMRQLASIGNPADPGVKFRKAFLELAQAASDKNVTAIKRLAPLPLNIAREQNWALMEIAVHHLMASAYIGLNKATEAIARYDTAIALARKAMAAGDKTAGKLAVQSLQNKGSVLLSISDYGQAATAYELAAVLAREGEDYLQVMEAKRMQGFCLEKQGDSEIAFEVEKEALQAAERLEESLRFNSTLPYLGQSLLELAYRFCDKKAYGALEEKITALAGPNWQSKVPRSKVTPL